MVATLERLPEHAQVDADQFVYLRLDWPRFEQFLELRGEASGPRLAVRDGTLELMGP